MSLRRTRTTSITLVGVVTAGELAHELAALPARARLTITVTPPDRPGEMTTTTIRATVDDGPGDA